MLQRRSPVAGFRNELRARSRSAPDVTTLAVHFVNNRALTGATYDMDGKSGPCNDVRANADGILARLSDGSIPCDGAWPQEQVELF
jgi:hypothetical protein